MPHGRTNRVFCIPPAAALFLLMAQGVGVSQVAITVASGSAVAGNAGSLTLSLAAAASTPPSGLQWLLSYSPNDLSGVTLVAGSALSSAGKTLSCTSATGVQKCVVWGINTTPIPNGVLATVQFTVSPQAAASSVLAVTGTSAASSSGTTIVASGGQATLTISPPTLLSKMVCNPSVLATPASATCTLTLVAAASSAVTVALGMGTSMGAIVIPSSLSIAKGATTATFIAQASSVTTSTTVILVATLNGSVSFSLSLQPPLLLEPPVGLGVTPSSGAGVSQTFALKYSDANGATDLSQLFAIFNTGAIATNACYVFYARSTNKLYLQNNASSAWQGPLTPGVAGNVSNSQCTLNSAASSVSTSGNTLTVNIALTFQPAFAGTKNIYLFALDSLGFKTAGWQLKGSWKAF